MRIQVEEVIAGTTIMVTWVSSATPVSSGWSAIFSGSESLISSAQMVDSGDGRHWFAKHFVPDSPAPCYWGNRVLMRIGVETYVNRQLLKSFRLEVD